MAVKMRTNFAVVSCRTSLLSDVSKSEPRLAAALASSSLSSSLLSLLRLLESLRALSASLSLEMPSSSDVSGPARRRAAAAADSLRGLFFSALAR